MSARDYYEAYWSRPGLPTDADPFAATRLRLLREALPPDPAGLRLLDVGAGLGDLVGALRRDGVDASGMDVSERAVALASERNEGCRFVRHSAEELPWPVEPGSLDAVVAFEVIEHLLRPRRLLEGAREALAPGGHLALTTPYHGLIKNLALAALAFDRHFAVEGDHIRFFSDRALRRLLDEAGFSVERTRHFGRAPGLWAGVFVWARRR